MNAMTPKDQTAAQVSRQTIGREHRTGRYTRHNPCELCGKSAGANYYSDERCNRWEQPD